MALPYISVEDCFPVIRQTILDAYKVDSFLMHYPYSDLERLDMGLRKMVWGTYSQYTSSMQQVYYNLPVVEMQSLITTLQHLITAFIPGFAANHVEYINYTSEQHEVDFNEERIHKFTSDYMANLAEHIKSFSVCKNDGHTGASRLYL